MTIVAPFLFSFALSAALVPFCRRLAVRLGRVAQPRADRWNGRPVAMLGGGAISLSLFAAASGFGGLEHRPVLVACAGLAFLTRLVDDLTTLQASTKLIVQIALAPT